MGRNRTVYGVRVFVELRELDDDGEPEYFQDAGEPYECGEYATFEEADDAAVALAFGKHWREKGSTS